MSSWTLDLVTGAVHDYEGAQYRILSNLQAVRRAFAQNQIYPHLGELIHFYGTLQTITQKSEGLREALPTRLQRIDLEAQEVVYERPDLTQDQLQAVEELIHWSLPQLKSAIEEGKTIFEFVEENLHLEEVGLVPSYVHEGYLLVPDYGVGELHILQYSLSIFMRAEERYRSLTTTHLKSIPYRSVAVSPGSVKLSLVEERRELPNPATYYFATELDFPFESTMLPVAKRKLMRHLFGQGGSA